MLRARCGVLGVERTRTSWRLVHQGRVLRSGPTLQSLHVPEGGPRAAILDVVAPATRPRVEEDLDRWNALLARRTEPTHLQPAA